MEIKDYLRVLRERWLIIVLVTLLGLGGALAATLSATPIYESTARLFVTTPQSDQTDEAYRGGLLSQQRVKSYASLMTGEEVASRVIAESGSDLSPAQLVNRTRTSVETDTVVLSVMVTDPSAEQAQLLAQTSAEVFVDFVAELETAPGRSTAPVKATIVDPAVVPSSQVSPQPIRNIALGLLLGLLAGAGLAVLRETLDNRIRSEDDIAEATEGAAHLGGIQFDKNAAQTPLISSLDSYAPRVESFRILRTNLQFVNVDADSRAYVVTSSVPAEGKTSTVVNLALSLADSGQRVLVIEADMRRPKAANYLGMVNSVGLTNVLARQMTLDEALQPHQPNLDVLASGPTPPNPAELLGSAAMRELLHHARTDYDIVLLDAPPLLPVTDAAIVAAEADGAILVVRHGDTTTDQLRGALDRLHGVDARVVGTVLNMTPRHKRKSGYGYGYGYGYAPEPERADQKTRAQDPQPSAGEWSAAHPQDDESEPPLTVPSADPTTSPPARKRRRRT